MPQISLTVWDSALAREVAVIDGKLWLARVTLGRLGAVLTLLPVDVAQAHVGVYNDAVAQANQALDNVKAAVTGGTHPRAVELVADIPTLEMWIDDALAQGIPFNAAVEGGNAAGAIALIPDMQAALADAQTATQLLAGVVEAGKVSGLRLEDTALALTVDDPVPLTLTSRSRGPVLVRVPGAVVELIMGRKRSAGEVAWAARLAEQPREVRRDVVVAQPLVGLRLAG